MATTHIFNFEHIELITTVVKTIAQLDHSLGELLSNISSRLSPDYRPIVALDIQKHYYQDDSKGKRQVAEKVVVLKLCFDKTCLIIQLLHIEEPPCSLAEFFQMQELSFVGVGIRHCLDALSREYGFNCRNAIDLGMLAATVENDKYKPFGLLDLAYELEVLKGRHWIWHKVSGTVLGNWGAATLSQQQIEAATRGVFLCSCVADYLLRGEGYKITLSG